MKFIGCGFRSRWLAWNWPWSRVVNPRLFFRLGPVTIMYWTDNGWEIVI